LVVDTALRLFSTFAKPVDVTLIDKWGLGTLVSLWSINGPISWAINGTVTWCVGRLFTSQKVTAASSLALASVIVPCKIAPKERECVLDVGRPRHQTCARRDRRWLTVGTALTWIIHENIYRHGLAADGGFHRPQSPLGVPKSVLEPIQRPKRMNMQLDVAELIRQKCS